MDYKPEKRLMIWRLDCISHWTTSKQGDICRRKIFATNSKISDKIHKMPKCHKKSTISGVIIHVRNFTSCHFEGLHYHRKKNVRTIEFIVFVVSTFWLNNSTAFFVQFIGIKKSLFFSWDVQVVWGISRNFPINYFPKYLFKIKHFFQNYFLKYLICTAR